MLLVLSVDFIKCLIAITTLMIYRVILFQDHFQGKKTCSGKHFNLLDKVVCDCFIKVLHTTSKQGSVLIQLYKSVLMFKTIELHTI